MIFMINAVNCTARVNGDSLRIRYYGAMRSDCSFLLEFPNISVYDVRAGMELRIHNDDGTVLWGGIIERVVYKYRASDFISLSVFARGYEIVVSRKILTSFNSSFQNLSAALQFVFDSALFSEGFTFDSDGVPSIAEIMTGQSDGVITAEEALDLISNFYGVCWWIDKNKVFKCCESFTVAQKNFNIAVGNVFHAGLSDFAFAESIEDYRNKQYISVGDDAYSLAMNSEEILEMSEYFGTGEYCKIMKRSGVTDSEYGNGLAQKILNNYPGVPGYIRFTVEDFSPELFDQISVYGGIFGNSIQPFAVISVENRYRYGKVFSTVTGRLISGTTYTPMFNQINNISFNI